LVVVVALATGEREAWGRVGFLVLLGIGSVLATLVNPYGLGLYDYIRGLLSDTYFMKLHTEWLSPNFHKPGSMRYELPMLLFPAVLALSARRPNLVELTLSVLWLHFALNGFRYVALWVVVAVPLMARASLHIAWLNETATKWGLSAESPDSLFHTRRDPSPWLWSVVIAVALFGGAKLFQGQLVKHDQAMQPTDVLDRFLEHLRKWKEENGRRPVLFHDYEWGGHITWHGWPEFLNWIDDRNEVQGTAHVQEHIDITAAKEGWQQKLRRADWACVHPDVPLAKALAHDKEWVKVEENAQAIIFKKAKASAR
jgi:hypothetical protein